MADITASVHFYTEGLGVEVFKVTEEITFLSTPGAQDLLALQLAGGDLDRAKGKSRAPGDAVGVDHIGFDVSDTDASGAVVGTR